MSSDQQRIWYSLVQADGTPFSNSTAASVLMSLNQIIDDLRKAIKAENENKLAKVDSSDLKVFRSKADLTGLPLGEETPVSDLGEAGKKKNTALLVLIPGSRVSSRSPLETCLTSKSAQSSLKPFRQQRYRRMSVETSCRKYFNAIATKLSCFYRFDYRHEDGPTIGDVLMAKDGNQGFWKEGDGDQEVYWDFKRATRTYEQVDSDGFYSVIHRGEPLKKERLPDLFSPSEWSIISQLNKKTSERVHDGQLPNLQNGKPYIIIPHSEFTSEMVASLKNIAVKASLFYSPDDLVVKDEDDLSEG
ncbi:hypothetical protein MIR68_003212 [Amoeboaphelidium protococcarum]|nr:hypothetical protein MIR68_003212 [Amoeboaphelidium protococcarum]